jgi:hypothetical protein
MKTFPGIFVEDRDSREMKTFPGISSVTNWK